MKNKKFWNEFIIGFVNGIGILLPVFITVLIVKFLVQKLNNAILSPLLKLFSMITPGDPVQHILWAKIVIFILVLLGIAFIGFAAKVIIIRRFFALGEMILLKVPIFGKIYKAVKEISSAFFGQGKTAFKNVVMVEYPRKGVFTVGFTTSELKGELRNRLGSEYVAVMVPSTPNPTTGFFLIFKREEVVYLDMPVEDGLKIIISVGSVIPGERSIADGNI